MHFERSFTGKDMHFFHLTDNNIRSLTELSQLPPHCFHNAFLLYLVTYVMPPVQAFEVLCILNATQYINQLDLEASDDQSSFSLQGHICYFSRTSLLLLFCHGPSSQLTGQAPARYQAAIFGRLFLFLKILLKSSRSRNHRHFPIR